jgi:hypothetical protein
MCRILFVIAVALSVVGCGGVQQMSETLQTKDTNLRAGIGDTIVTINQKKSLPNAFGQADVFGRTTPTGMVTVQYLGGNGQVARFQRSSMAIETGATTMNSTPLVIPTQQTTHLSGTAGTTPVYGTATTSGVAVIPAKRPQAQVLQQAPVTFEIDIKKSPTFTVGGTTVRVLRATSTELVYRLQ